MATSRFSSLVADAKQRIREVTPDEMRTRLARGDKLHLIDVREESEWAQGHASGAVHFSKGTIERDLEKQISDTAAELVLYCGGGSRSALAADNLQKMGYTNVWSLAGGYKGWRDAGLPTETLQT
ncbi:MAG TPA: rhodanese-like domain-containing protein [Pirellulales bacterium]|nr:rhodanese-like domain-containing protein [Pirellulales bacterium]